MLSFYSHRTIKALSVATVGFVVFVGVGMLMTRLTVHDLVDVSLYQCGNPETLLSIHQDNPLERVAMHLGRSRVVSVSETSVILESFTIYHIPIEALKGQIGVMTTIECLPVSH